VTQSKQIGDQAEQLALTHLQQAGLTLVTRNFRRPGGEIDLIMLDNKTLIFVEVRYRKSARFGSALESVNKQKQQRLIQTASAYIQQSPTAYANYRFDVVAIMPENKSFNINWLKDAFQLN
tara:strand:+ start:455 stop:817 length:363 start_codon:yes stop_codon:yes gene_type:complete